LLAQGYREEYWDAHFRLAPTQVARSVVPDRKLTSATVEEVRWRRITDSPVRRRYVIRLLRDPAFASNVDVAIYYDEPTLPPRLDAYDLRVRQALRRDFLGKTYATFTPQRAHDERGAHWLYSFEPGRAVTRSTIVWLCNLVRRRRYGFGPLRVITTFGWIDDADLRRSGLPPQALIFTVGQLSRNLDQTAEIRWAKETAPVVRGSQAFRQLVAQVLRRKGRGRRASSTP
jgi:hypothetical protein